MPKLIVFDLNKTLIEENSWLNLNLAMGVTQAEDDLLVSWGQEGIISDAEAQAILCSIYKKRSNPTRDRVLEVVRNYTYRPEAQATVKRLGELGFAMALISGSMDVLVEHVAKELGIVHWACNNHFIFDENDRLDSISTEDDDHIYKVHQLEQLCSQLGIDKRESMCVGDGANDVLLFNACGNGVTFSDSAYADKAKHVIGSLDELVGLVA